VAPKPAEDRRDSAPPETHIAEIERAVSMLPAEALERLARLYFTPRPFASGGSTSVTG
jgi:hypothetical protein